MTTRTITCRGCGATLDVPCASSAPQIAEVHGLGWGVVWDVSNGLAPAWLCGVCGAKVADLAQQILNITKLKHPHFNSLLHPLRRPKGAKP